MARPKYRPGDTPARDKLIAAFWQLLSERPFDQITVRLLSEAAGLNHNTFYYHFGSMEELAKAALDDTAPFNTVMSVAPTFLRTGLIPAELNDSPELERAFLRMKLFAKSDSPLLNSMIRKKITSIWAVALGIDEEALGPDARKSISFLIGGAMAVLGDYPDLELRDFFDMLAGSIGSAARSILAQLAAGVQGE